jgi:hypothetical protein
MVGEHFIYLFSFFFLFNETRYVNANIMRFYYFRFFVRARVLDGVFTTSNVRDTIMWLLVVIENVKSRLALMSLQNANADCSDGGGDRPFYSHIIIFSDLETV